MRNTHPVTTGIGWGKDLAPKVGGYDVMDGAGIQEAHYHPHVESGYYYLGGQERYLFALEQNMVQTVGVGVTLLYLPDLSIPTQVGPILAEGAARNLTRLGANLAVFRPVTPVALGATDYMTIFASGDVVLVTGADGTDMDPVPASGFLTERSQYYFDGNYIWIRRDLADANRDETLYVTYLKPAPEMYQEEILLADSDGNLRTQLSPVAGMLIPQPSWTVGPSGAGPSFNHPLNMYMPVITLPGSGVFGALAVASGNVVVPSGAIAQGTRAGVGYYVDGSFVIGASGSVTAASGFSILPDQVLFRWDGTITREPYNASRYQPPDPRYIELNPLVYGVDDGFLYGMEPYNLAELASDVDLYITPELPYSDFGAPVWVIATVYDGANRALPGVSITGTVVIGGTVYPLVGMTTVQETGTTDLRGKKRFYFVPPQGVSGTATVSVWATDGDGNTIPVSGTATLNILGGAPDGTGVCKIILYLNPNLDAENLQQLYIYALDPGGLPYPNPVNVFVTALTGRLFPALDLSASGLGGGASGFTVSIPNPATIGICRYQYAPLDELIGCAVQDGAFSLTPNSWPLVPMPPTQSS